MSKKQMIVTAIEVLAIVATLMIVATLSTTTDVLRTKIAWSYPEYEEVTSGNFLPYNRTELTLTEAYKIATDNPDVDMIVRTSSNRDGTSINSIRDFSDYSSEEFECRVFTVESKIKIYLSQVYK